MHSCETIESADYDVGDHRIEAHTTLSLRFAEARHFDWGRKALNGRRIYISLHFAGRRSILKKVYQQ